MSSRAMRIVRTRTRTHPKQPRCARKSLLRTGNIRVIVNPFEPPRHTVRRGSPRSGALHVQRGRVTPKPRLVRRAFVRQAENRRQPLSVRPITARDEPPASIGGSHSAHGLQFGSAPRSRRPGALKQPAPQGPRGCAPSHSTGARPPGAAVLHARTVSSPRHMLRTTPTRAVDADSARPRPPETKKPPAPLRTGGLSMPQRAYTALAASASSRSITFFMASIAHSTWPSSGSRVVRRCICMPGHRMTLTNGLSGWLPAHFTVIS